MLLVIIGTCGIFQVDTLCLEEFLLAIVAVEELSVPGTKVGLKPALSIGYVPEAVCTNVNLRDGLGVGAFDKRTDGEHLITHDGLELPAASL